MQNINAQFDGSNIIEGTWKVDHTQGTTNGAVSSQWFNRPDDQRFTSLDDLYEKVRANADNSRADVISSKEIRVEASQTDPDKLQLALPNGEIANPTHWSFGQAASLVGAPAGYLRKLPAAIAGINLQHGLLNHRRELVKSYTTTDGQRELRAFTGPDYGRIYDWEIVKAVQQIAGDGRGSHHWKIPGVMNWADGTYNPDAAITRESTTLFASDRDIFIFLVDDKRPIQVGTLPDGSPDLMFRGFYVSNSEVGARTVKLACFYLRGVCQNRMLWGVERFKEINMRHSKFAPSRFAREIYPALEDFSQASDSLVIQGVQAAKAAIVANDDDQRADFLSSRGFTKAQTQTIIQSVVDEEGKKPESVWDFVQGITAVARETGHQDARIDLEKRAGKLLDRVA